METVATCSTTDSNGSYHGLAPSFSKRWHIADVKKHFRRRPDNPNGPSKFRKYRVYLPLLRLFTSVRSRLLFHGSGSCHAPAPTYFEEMTRCRRQKLHWRWPGNPNGRAKFLNLGLFTCTRSQLTLRRRIRGWWQLREIAQTAHCRHQKHRRRWPGSIEIPQIHKFMPTRSSKASRKTSFCCSERRRDWRHCAMFFPAITGNGFCFHIRKIISRRPWPPPKNRDIHIIVFFVDSIYSKTIDIIRNIFFLFLDLVFLDSV